MARVFKSEKWGFSYTIPQEYLALIKEEDVRNVASAFSFSSNVRDTISRMYLRSNTEVIIYKMGRVSNESLKQRVSFLEESHKTSNLKVYGNAATDKYDLYYLEGKPDSITRLRLTVFGDSLKEEVVTDSLLSFYFKFQNFSISNDINGRIDLIGEVKRNGSADEMEPATLLFFKKNGNLYLLISSRRKNIKAYDQNLLKQVIEKS
ncbi:hypothetical protein DN068_07060 [Taibaiella soli]|uniref:Uncharacterized protein n=2 Tax=Taibaiella soli TaxID=1649169 RepID=A0A2W2BC11_9BACT|nr:hypothetical protein DN068_07060 [Taibaiella soli]